MKKTLLILNSLFIGGYLFAQQVQLPQDAKPAQANAVPYAEKYSSINSDRSMITGYIDYAASNLDDAGYLWRINNNYVIADTTGGPHTLFKFAGVAVNPFQEFTDYADVFNTETIYPATPAYPASLVYTVDSVFALISHENNSGQKDFYGIRLVTLNAAGGLSATNPVVWQQKDSTTTSLSSGGNWVGTGAVFTLGYAPNYTTTPGQKLGIEFFYAGPVEDTCGIDASFVEDQTNPGNTITQSPYKTSWIGIIYLSNGAPLAARTIGYGSPVGSAGWFEAQDLQIWAKVTFNDITGISDNEMNKNMTLYQNIPNPAEGTTLIKYDLTKATEVSLMVTDITGRKVMEQNEGLQSEGKHQLTMDVSSFSKGVYFYSLVSNGISLTKKMVITH